MIMIVKLEPGNKEQISDIDKYSFIQGQSICGTNCLQRH